MDNLKNEVNERIYSILFSLLRVCLNQENVPDSFQLTQEEFEALLKLAKRHEVQPMVAYGLLLSGSLTDQQEQNCRYQVYQAMLHQQRMEYELDGICRLLDTVKIPYIPLKGAVIRKHYPEHWMRTSGDIDILVKNVDDAAKLLVDNGYTRKEKDAHEITFLSPNRVTIELHYMLIETDPKVNALLEKVWEYSSCHKGTSRYEMEPEILYYYHVAHMAKHMLLGGCGIRFFTDTWLLNKKLTMDEGKKDQMLQKGGIAVFAKQAERLSQVWLENSTLDPLLLELEEYIFNGGTFGSKSNEIKLYRMKTGESSGFLLQRIFKPYNRMTMQFPVLKKYPFLLPVFWVMRWFSLLFRRKKIHSAMQELAMNKKMDKNAVTATKQLFQELELL